MAPTLSATDIKSLIKNKKKAKKLAALRHSLVGTKRDEAHTSRSSENEGRVLC